MSGDSSSEFKGIGLMLLRYSEIGLGDEPAGGEKSSSSSNSSSDSSSDSRGTSDSGGSNN